MVDLVDKELLTTGSNVREEIWNHVVYTYTSDTLRMYLNGTEINKQYKSWDWNNSISTSGNLYIGAYGPNSNPFLGQLMMLGYMIERYLHLRFLLYTV